MPYLVLMTDGHHGTRFALNKQMLSIGRSPNCDIYLDDPAVSFEHATLVVKGANDESVECWIEDESSTNGTFVNSEKVESARLTNNDSINIGLSSFKFIDDDQQELQSTQQIKKSWIPGVFYLKEKS